MPNMFQELQYVEEAFVNTIPHGTFVGLPTESEEFDNVSKQSNNVRYRKIIK